METFQIRTIRGEKLAFGSITGPEKTFLYKQVSFLLAVVGVVVAVVRGV